MDSEELNLVIRCGFEKDNLIRQLDSVNNIVGVLDPEEYDYDKSINNFQYLCKRALALVYGSDAVIKCEPSIPTRVYRAGKIDLVEAEHVQEIVSKLLMLLNGQ